MSFKFSISIFCGSRDGGNPIYLESAQDIGKAFAKHQIRLVYGAGDVGLMGETARSTQKYGGKTLGVIPQHLVDQEVAKTDLDAYIITENMHERKKIMFMNSDCIIALPGGAGTLDEFFEVLTWRQIGLHEKPLYLLNINGFWDPLLKLIDHVISEGFASESLKTYFNVENSVDLLMPALLDDLSKRHKSSE